MKQIQNFFFPRRTGDCALVSVTKKWHGQQEQLWISPCLPHQLKVICGAQQQGRSGWADCPHVNGHWDQRQPPNSGSTPGSDTLAGRRQSDAGKGMWAFLPNDAQLDAAACPTLLDFPKAAAGTVTCSVSRWGDALWVGDSSFLLMSVSRSGGILKVLG